MKRKTALSLPFRVSNSARPLVTARRMRCCGRH